MSTVMREHGRLEFVVGVFVLVGILCLGYLAIKLGKLEFIGGNYYELHADFSSSAGFKKRCVGGNCRSRSWSCEEHRVER